MIDDARKTTWRTLPSDAVFFFIGETMYVYEIQKEKKKKKKSKVGTRWKERRLENWRKWQKTKLLARRPFKQYLNTVPMLNAKRIHNDVLDRRGKVIESWCAFVRVRVRPRGDEYRRKYTYRYPLNLDTILYEWLPQYCTSASHGPGMRLNK